MLVQSVAAILDRDLRALRRELEAYPDERDLWRLPPGVANSAGTLALHLAGNLQHYLGAVLGATGYVRDRPAEFAARDLPRAKLLQDSEAARAAVRAGTARLREQDLEADFPEVLGGARIQLGDYLVHLVSHFSYHLGQIDYHRRVVTGGVGSVDAVRPTELSTARAATEKGS
ncbi:MAG: DinB family protein [Gemmatimonadales bacterium]|nr:DinB family protein [Gemmatimonadales bacterium]